ncbi:MAG TPA: hypothetical protein VN325_23295 [Steroidobacteraceae bacterium]|nr:hypothetical protein [Steroidobacteraceae bacterium]
MITQGLRLPSIKVAPFPRKKFLDFCSHLRIQTKDFGMIPMQMLGTQSYVLDQICEAVDRGVTTILILKARQLGMTTFFIALDLFWAMEYSGLLGAFVTHTDQAKAFFRNTIKIYFANLPRTHRVKWDQENRDMIVLKNGSLLQYLVAGTKEKTKGGLGRSSANNFIHATEVAFWGSPDDLNELSATMSTHYPHRLKIEETTANGFNFWEERWREGKEDPTICCIFVGWWRHDHYSYSDEHPWFLLYMPKGHDTPLTRLERTRYNAVEKRYGIKVSHNQIAWYRWKLETENYGDQTKMDEMFPWLEEDAFVSTGAQFFSSPHITEAAKKARTIKFMPFKYEMGDHWRDTSVVAVRTPRAELKVWEEADPNGHYAIGCDPAYGSGPDADSSVIHVARCFSDRVVQVAEFVTPLVSTYQCAWALCHLAGYYRNVMVNLEITGPGEAVFNEMNKLRRETQMMVDRTPDGKISYDLRLVLTMMRHFLYSRVDSLTQQLAYQWRTSGSNKFGMMAAFKDAFELGRYEVRSLFLLEEMKTIVIDGGQVEAESGKKDDRVMAGALAHEAHRRWIQPKLEALGLTYARAMAEKEGHGPSLAEKVAINYLKMQGLGDILRPPEL